MTHNRAYVEVNQTGVREVRFGRVKRALLARKVVAYSDVCSVCTLCRGAVNV